MKTLITLPRKTKVIVSVILILLIILGYYISIYKSYYYQSDNMIIGGVMIIISLMVYRMLWLKEYKSRAKRIVLIIVQVIIAITIIVSLSIIEVRFESDEINKNGVDTDAQITGIEIETSRKRGDRYYATIHYTFDKRTIIQRISDDDRNYKAGDLVKIRFSKKYPEMFRVIKESKKLWMPIVKLLKKCNKGTKECNETAAQNGLPFPVFSTFKTKMTTVEKQLWDKLGRFGFDSEGTQLTFAKRLARENGWNDYYTNRVIEEYKKFIFLCCVSPTPVTPSDPVDQAWHLHLTYTKSYWDEFCENTLGRKIHHNPTKGGRSEQQKFDGCYTNLKEIYTEKFGTPPPPDIWQDNDERFGDINFQRVNMRNYWLVPRPGKPFWDIAVQSLLIASGLLCIQASPGNVFIIIFVIAFIVSALRNRNNKGGGGSGSGCTASCASGDSDGHSGCSSHGDSGCSSGCSGCGGGCGGD